MLKNVREEKYCQLRACGKSQRQAYLEAFPSAKRWKNRTVDVRACELEHRSDIKVRLRELAEDNALAAGLSRKKLLDKLEEIINAKHVQFKSNDIIRAIELYAKICGYNNISDENIEDISQAESDVFGV